MACVTDTFDRSDTISTSTLIADAFGRANGAIGNADVGGAWSVLGGNWQVATNRAACTDGTSRQDNVAVIDSGAADVTLTVDVPVRAPTSESGAGIGIAFRSSNVSNRLQLIVFTSGGGTVSLILQKIVAGTPTTLNSVVATPATIKVLCIGSSITCYADGVAQFTVTETFNQTVTKHGLTSYWSSAARLDNFTCTTQLNTGLGNADTGQTWVEQKTAPYDTSGSPIAQVTSKLGIIGNAAASVDLAHVELATIDHGFADVDMSVDVVAPFANAGGGGSILRWASDAAFWQAFVFRTGAGNYDLYLRKVIDATHFTDVAVAAGIYASGHTGAITLRTVAKGSNIKCYIDGALQFSATDAFNQAATRHGVETYGSTTVRLDNYSGCPLAVGGWRVGSIGMS